MPVSVAVRTNTKPENQLSQGPHPEPDWSIEPVYNQLFPLQALTTMTSQTIGAYEAKTHLPQFLRQVQAGQTFDISVRGVTVARLVPVQATEKQRSQAVAQMREFTRQQHASGAGTDLDLASLIGEGRA